MSTNGIPGDSICEVRDLDNPTRHCEHLGKWPKDGTSGFGGLFGGTIPVICGGYDNNEPECYKLGSTVPVVDTLSTFRHNVQTAGVMINGL